MRRGDYETMRSGKAQSFAKRHSLIVSLSHRLIVFFLFASSVHAGVRAEVSQIEVGPNQQVSYSIVFENVQPGAVPSLNLPPQIKLMGRARQQQQMGFDTNGQQFLVARYTWALVATEPGEFVIPAQDIVANSAPAKTNEVRLVVKEGFSGPAESEALLQISVDKTEIYQSEVVPVKATLFVPTSMRLRSNIGLIDLAKSDFAVQRFPLQSEQAVEVVGNQQYFVYTFRSTLSALKTGKLKLGPASTEFVVDEITRNDPRFPPGFAMQAGEPRRLQVRSQEINVTVLPLPAEGKPLGFSGAVGDFTLTARASPTSLAVGEPITVELAVTGVGNFDALVSPSLTKPEGWKTYPARRYNTNPSADPNAPQNMERQIGFTQVMVPEKQIAALPPFEMSFFSPTQKQYVVQRTEPITLQVRPGVGQPDAATAVAASASADTSVVRPPEADITDILLHLPSSPSLIGASGTSLLRRPLFWAVNALPLTLLIGALLIAYQRRRVEAAKDDRHAALRVLWQELNEAGSSQSEFYRRAARFIQSATDGASPPESVREVLRKYETLNFSASDAHSSASVTQSERTEVLAALAPLLAAKKKPTDALIMNAAVASRMIAFFAALIFTSAADAASPLQQRYDEVVAALEKKDFNRAQALTESIMGEGVLSPELFEIMGHTRYRQGDLGKAVLWYERASLFTPGVPEIRQNLRHLGDKLRYLQFIETDPAKKLGLLFMPNTWILIASGGGWLALLGIAGALVIPKKNLRVWSTVAACIGVLVLAAAITGMLIRPAGAELVKDRFIVTNKGAKSHTAASITAGTVIELPPGSALRLLEKRGAWSYVEIPSAPDNLRGWVESDILNPLWPWPVALVP